jgi:hypothetical protein
MVGFGEAVLNALLLADASETVGAGVSIALAIGERHAVIGSRAVALVGYGGNQVA